MNGNAEPALTATAGWESPATRLTRDLTATGRTEQSGNAAGERPETTGRRMPVPRPPRNPRRARGRRSHVPLCAPVPVPVPVPLTAAPARARSPAHRRRLASHAAPGSPRAPAPPRKRRARRHGNAARPARAQPPPHTHLQKEVIYLKLFINIPFHTVKKVVKALLEEEKRQQR